MITSSANGQIKNLIKLQKSAKARKQQGVFLVEGLRLFREVPKEQIVKVYITEEFLEKHEELLQEIEYELVTNQVLKEASDTKTPQGVMAVVKMLKYSLDELKGYDNPCFMVLENIQDPGNLGTIIRTSEGANITAVLMSEDTVDIYNSKVVRSTMGSIFRTKFIYLSMEEIFTFLKEEKITTYGAHLDGQDFYEEDYKTACAFFIGNEGNGLTEETTRLVERKIKIPMYGQIESLNAAIAGTVLMYEAMRQRRQ
ncbi:MAG: RNA methyltransferase [Firmicutes bacterium]|uniref:RNA methyltransferase n=1 Tax=Candidatus Scybalomonas excrementavium TaxID=2840943 RepID=A0A9D9N6I8_9FIRM|nr:RNA methyltransferase [Candidatus Scybalomonas excrementavium]